MNEISRVAFVLPDLEYSGPTYNALTLARELSTRGVKTLSAALDGGERVSSFEVSGLAHLHDRHLGGFLRGHEARHKVADFNPDVVHALDLSVLPVGLRLAERGNKPLAVTVNRPLSGDEKHLELLSRVLVVAVSDHVRADLARAARIPHERVLVIPNGVDLSRHQYEDETPDPLDERHRLRVVGTFGSLLPHKGQRFFLEAAKKILEKRADVEFLIMGQGPDQRMLRNYAQELGILRRVTFTSGATFATAATDRIAGHQESVFLRDFDIYVEPSTQEGLGLSVMQAMAWARPVVAFASGGLYSLVEDGRTGFLVQKGDAAALADRIGRLLADRERAREMGRRGREKIAAQFNIKDSATRHLEAYAEMKRSQGKG